MVIFLLNHSVTGYAEETRRDITIDNYNKFFNVWIAPEYDFKKVKKVFVFDTDTADFSIYAPDLAEINKKNVKKMKLKVTDKETADVYLQIKIKNWKSNFERHIPEQIVYEAYESYEGYKDVERYEDQEYYDNESKKMVRRRVKVRRKEFVVDSSWFFGSKKIVTPYERVSGSHKISQSTPFPGSQKVVYPAYDLFASQVKVLFELYDAGSNNLIMTLEGSKEISSSKKSYQMKLYEEISYSFF